MSYNKVIGQFGEDIAKNYLVKKGYIIVEQNVKTSYQEIDIIAKKDRTLIFIEVKTRTSLKFGSAEEAVTNIKTTNLKKAIKHYYLNNNLDNINIRADLVAVDIDKMRKIAKIKHYKDII